MSTKPKPKEDSKDIQNKTYKRRHTKEDIQEKTYQKITIKMKQNHRKVAKYYRKPLLNQHKEKV